MSYRRARIATLLAGLVVAGLVWPLADAPRTEAAGCGTYRCTILDAITAVTGVDGATNFSAWLLGDFNRDGILDLYGIQTKNTASGHVEVHVLSGASDYKSWLLHAILPISAADAANVTAWGLADYDHDGLPDLFGIKTLNTGSGFVEVHVLAASTHYRSFLLHSVSPVGVSDGSQNFAAWQVGTFNNQSEPDLFGIQTKNTGSGRVEVHELSGSSRYHSFSFHAATAFTAGAATFAAWQMSSFSSDGQPDLYGVKNQQTGSGDVEVHVVSRSSRYATFILHAASSFPDATSANYGTWAFGDFNSAGILDLYGIQTAGTGSGQVEADVVNGYDPPSSNCSTYNACSPQTFADALFVYAGVDAPATGSNEAALEVWERAEGGGAGCPGQRPFTQPWAYSAGPAGNPLNTTQREPGSTNWNNLGGGIGVQIFANFDNRTCWYWGMTATGTTLLNGFYGPILSVLRKPNPDSYDQCVALARGVGSTPWGTGNFQTDCSQLVG
jgi:hypothetical protein